MAEWQQWEKIADGPYQGKPILSVAGLGSAGFFIDVADARGDVILRRPGGPGVPAEVLNTGGGDVIAHLPDGPFGTGGFAVGVDKRLYRRDYATDTIHWRLVEGPGLFTNAVVTFMSMDGSAEIIGVGLENQLVYSFVTPSQSKAFSAPDWDTIGKPNIQGVVGSPAAMHDDERLHVVVRGGDGHLWTIVGENSQPLQKRTFGQWVDLGGSTNRDPIIVRSKDRIECFVVGKDDALYVNTWDGHTWGGFEALEGQIQGLPAAVTLWEGDDTFVFARGVHDQLWYRRRQGNVWAAWQSVGDAIAGDPVAGMEHLIENGGGAVVCVVLRNNGELWRRYLMLADAEYYGEQT